MSKAKPARDPEQDAADDRMLAHILAFAQSAHGIGDPEEDDEDIDPEVLAHEQEQRTWFTGMFMYGSTTVIDGLFADIAMLHAGGRTADIRDTQQLSGLPAQFASQYTALFAQRFLVATLDVTRQFAQGWVHPSTLAEELAVRLVLDEVDFLAETAPLTMDKGFRGYWEDLLYQDVDFEWLYNVKTIGYVMDGLSVEPWFETFANAVYSPSLYARGTEGEAYEASGQ